MFRHRSAIMRESTTGLPQDGNKGFFLDNFSTFMNLDNHNQHTDTEMHEISCRHTEIMCPVQC